MRRRRRRSPPRNPTRSGVEVPTGHGPPRQRLTRSSIRGMPRRHHREQGQRRQIARVCVRLVCEHQRDAVFAVLPTGQVHEARNDNRALSCERDNVTAVT